MAAYLIPPIETVVIKPWLEAKLKARGITAHTHKFASEMRVTSATIYRWYSDQYRPTPAMMKRVCETLSRIPVKLGDDGPFTWRLFPRTLCV